MAVNLSSLAPGAIKTVKFPDPVARQKTLADLAASAQAFEMRGLQIEGEKRRLATDEENRAKALKIQKILESGNLKEAYPQLLSVDFEVAQTVKSLIDAQEKAATAEETLQRTRAVENLELMEGQPGERAGGFSVDLPGAEAATNEQGLPVSMPLPGGNISRASVALPHTPIQIPGGPSITPRTAEQLNEEKLADFEAQERIKSGISMSEAATVHANELEKIRAGFAKPTTDTSVTEVELAIKAARGDKEADAALKRLVEQRRADDRPFSPTVAVAQIPNQGMGTSFSDALGRATMTMPQTRRNQTIATVNAMIQRGDERSARDTIRQAALESEPVAVRQQAQARREVIDTLDDIEKLLRGVPTNLLVGTAEDVARKLGTSTDTRYVSIANRLLVLNQNYRRSMTGAQFSIPESAEYAQVFPSYKNTAPVNKELVQSLKEAFGRNDRSFWDFKLGPGWAGAGNARDKVQFTSSDGQQLEVDADKWPEVQRRDPGARRRN